MEISFPFTVGSNGGIVTVDRPEDVARQHVHTVLLTNYGERVMRPRFGANLRTYVFETTNETFAGMLSDRIVTALAAGAPEVVARGVHPVLADDGTYVIDVGYQLRSDTSAPLDTMRLGIDIGSSP